MTYDISVAITPTPIITKQTIFRKEGGTLFYILTFLVIYSTLACVIKIKKGKSDERHGNEP
jgi:hypothetical protein